jgi:hypothetical protein
MEQGTISKIALLQVQKVARPLVRRGFQADLLHNVDTLIFCVKKWYNSAFTIHQFDNA